MLIYPRAWAGIPLLFYYAGSALPRAVVPGLIAASMTVMIEHLFKDEAFLNHLFDHPYPYTVFANMVGFALVFRTNVAYNRYWEGLSNLKAMTSKWGDAAALTLTFDRHERPAAPTEGQSNVDLETLESTRGVFASLLAHRVSLLHALACAHLRREASSLP